MSRVSFDLSKNAGFDGNASLSLVANYLPTRGAYEARWEYIGTDLAKNPKNNRGQRLALYRWNVSAGGKKTATLICAWTNTVFNMPNISGELAASTQVIPFFISVSNSVDSTWIITGLRRTPVTLGTVIMPASNSDQTSWAGIAFRDSSANRLASGTYGVLSANCDGVFARPQISSTVILPTKDISPYAGNTRRTKSRSCRLRGCSTLLTVRTATTSATKTLRGTLFPEG